MSSDPSSSMESDLPQRLQPAPLDDAFAARLHGCIAGNWDKITRDEAELEAVLRQRCRPAALPADIQAALDAALAAAAAPAAIPFPAPQRRIAWWRHAAAVAFLGAAAALLSPAGKPQPVAATHAPRSTTALESSSPSPKNSTELIPAGYKRGLAEAHDEGVIWQSPNRAHRVLKVIYNDRMTFKEPSGRTYQVEQPRVEYILVPTHSD